MRGWVIAAFVVLATWWVPSGHARAETTVEVIGTHPSGDEVTLGRNQNFYLHLAYSTDEPVKIWARPYFRGEPVDAGSNPSRTHTGSGETFGWFFFMEPWTQVDEIRISAGDGRQASTPVVATFAVHVVGGDGAPTGGAEPAWVGAMQSLAEAEQKKAYEARMNAPVSAGDIALFNGFMLVMFALGALGFAGPAWGLWRWRGGWRLAAAVPAVMMTFVVVRILLGTAVDPTSHNLWPFEVVMASALSAGVMLVLLTSRKLSGAR